MYLCTSSLHDYITQTRRLLVIINTLYLLSYCSPFRTLANARDKALIIRPLHPTVPYYNHHRPHIKSLSTTHHGSYFAEVTLRVTAGDSRCSSSSMPSSSSDASSAYREALLCRLNSCTYSDTHTGSVRMQTLLPLIYACYDSFIILC